MTNKTLYVSDLDGTLLNSNAQLSSFTINKINELIDKGMIFTFATARSLSSASKITNTLNLKHPVIVYNGAFIINPNTQEIISSDYFDFEIKQYVNNLLSSYEIYPLVYSYIDNVEKVSWMKDIYNEGLDNYVKSRKGDKRLNPLKDKKQLYSGNNFYYTCIGEFETLKPIYDILKRNNDVNCILQQELYREEYWLEIMPKKATKANAISKLKSILNCNKLVSFGDAINDKPMFDISDECYAVENAVEDLKNISTGTIGSNDTHSVAKWLWQNYHHI